MQKLLYEYSRYSLKDAIGRKKFCIKDQDYRSALINHPFLSSLLCIGPAFTIVGNMYTWQYEMISEGCEQVVGYTAAEIMEIGGDFLVKYIHPEDTEQCLALIRKVWAFLDTFSPEERQEFVHNFYYRAIRKDGVGFNVQHQVIDLVWDSQRNPLLSGNFITDISHLGLTEQVRVVSINTKTNQRFIIDGRSSSQLISYTLEFTKREKEIIRMLVQGLNNRQIAERLNISFHTARTHHRNILEKIGKKNTIELVKHALSHGLT